MINAVRRKFRRISSIELDASLYRKTAIRFARYGHIFILQGDSGQVLPEILAGIGGPCLFWLDAHWSGVTARGDCETPVVKEVAAILDHHERSTLCWSTTLAASRARMATRHANNCGIPSSPNARIGPWRSRTTSSAPTPLQHELRQRGERL